MSHSIDDNAFVQFAQQRWLLSEEDAQRCLERCRETGRPATEVAQELELLSASVAMIVHGLASETREPSDEVATQVLSAVAEPSPASVPDKGALARYQIRGELGRGAMAVVYEAHDTQMDRDVALKVLVDGLGDDLDVSRFQREAKAIAGMGRHPNIVTVYDFGADGGIFYYTMERVDGEPLDEWLGDQPRSLREIVEMVAGAARGLAHAHDHGVIHRDVKPENVLVTADGKPLVSDFGLARTLEVDSHLTATGMVLGTPVYMSPEQALGHTSDLTTATDVYGLGVVLYEAITGQLPFEGDGVVETLIAKLQQDPRPPRGLRPDLPGSLEVIILRSLARKVEQRYPDAHALEGALSGWLAGGTSAPPAPQAPALPAPPVPVAHPRKLVSGPTLVTAATVCVFALMGLMAILADRREGELKDQASLPPASPASGADVAVQVVIVKPEPDHLTASGEVIVSGRVTAGNAKEVWVGTQQVEVSEGEFQVDLSLEDGSHTLAVSLEHGGERLATVSLHVDTAAPLVSVDTPEDGDVLNVELLPIQGSVEDRHLETMQLADGAQVEMAEDGAFDLVYDLPDQDGEVTVELIARDRVGNETRHPIRVVVDRTVPELILETELQLVARVGADVTIRGRVNDAHPAVLYVDGQRNPLEADGGFSVLREVASEGTWEVLLQAEDAVGQRSLEQTVSIVGDGTPPRIEIEAPLENLVTRESEVTVRGRVTDTHGVAKLTVQGQVIALDPDGAFSTSVPVAEGETRIEVVAEDAAGNRVTLVRLVSLDTSPPAITLEPEPAAEHYGRPRIQLTGHIDEPGCTLNVNGKPVEIEAGRFSVTARLVAGENTLVLEATDRAGNVMHQERVVYYARREPKLPRGTWWEPTARQRVYANKSKLPLWIENDLGMRLVLIPPGRFVMGTPATSPVPGLKNEVPHQVKLTRGFYIGATEVTTGQLKSFMKQRSNADKPENLPAAWIECEDMQDFCEWLTRQARGKWLYRLPTEAEWEYAYRAEATTPFFWGNDPDEALRYGNMLDGVAKPQLPGTVEKPIPGDDGHVTSAPVGSYASSPYGLFDVAGNCTEVTWGAYPPGATWDPREPELRGGFVLRGSSYHNNGLVARSARRHPIWSAAGRSKDAPDGRKIVKATVDMGFRVVAIPLRAGDGR